MQVLPQQDSGHYACGSRLGHKTKYSKLYGRVTYRLLVFVPIFISIYAVPGTSHAGLLSFVAELLAKRANDSLPAETSNSQNMPLLEAVRSIDPRGSIGGGDIIIVGDSALLPESGPLGTLADIQDFSGLNHEISIYTVRHGDSLSAIAKMYGVSVNTIAWANDLGPRGTIREGQTLVILPVSGIQYSVTKGDTLDSVAKKFKGNVREIAVYNGLDADASLAIGQEIIIPDGEREAKKTPSAESRVAGAANQNNVASGYYMRPISGGLKSQGIHGYNGVDLATYQGAPIFAAASGEVILSREGGWNGGYGNYIVISHPNGTQTLYSHNFANLVSAGQFVAKGQQIGTIGSTGRSTGPHLHFEVRGSRNPF